MKHSKVLGSFSRDDFLTLVRAVSEVWEADALFSGCGYHGENLSVCAVLPVGVLEVCEATSLADVRSFCFRDSRPVIGFLSYDYGLVLKGIKSCKDRYIEYGLLKKYSMYMYHDGSELRVEADSQEMIEKAVNAYQAYDHVVKNSFGKIECNMTAKEYMGKVSDVLENIRSGNTYQLNLSLAYQADADISPLQMWADMAHSHPAPFYAYVKTLGGAIVSTSPERFIKVADGEVLSQPIKGTHHFQQYHEGIESCLTDSVKESAELSMIVDLIRNDISEHCEPGSVEVKDHKSVMRVDNLLQMYSSVKGGLKSGSDVLDILWSAFPGGSVTGCPKKSSMQLIESLEPHARGIYCGSIFMIHDKQNIDSSIAIRTGFYDGEKLRFFAGSGIVADSDPEKEYNESVSKAEKFLRLVQ